MCGALVHGGGKAFASQFRGENEAEDSGEDGERDPEKAPAVVAAVDVTTCGFVNELKQGDEQESADDGGKNSAEDGCEDLLIGHWLCPDSQILALWTNLEGVSLTYAALAGCDNV